jgi:hypothetical protein
MKQQKLTKGDPFQSIESRFVVYHGKNGPEISTMTKVTQDGQLRHIESKKNLKVDNEGKAKVVFTEGYAKKVSLAHILRDTWQTTSPEKPQKTPTGKPVLLCQAGNCQRFESQEAARLYIKKQNPDVFVGLSESTIKQTISAQVKNNNHNELYGFTWKNAEDEVPKGMRCYTHKNTQVECVYDGRIVAKLTDKKLKKQPRYFRRQTISNEGFVTFKAETTHQVHKIIYEAILDCTIPDGCHVCHLGEKTNNDFDNLVLVKNRNEIQHVCDGLYLGTPIQQIIKFKNDDAASPVAKYATFSQAEEESGLSGTTLKACCQTGQVASDGFRYMDLAKWREIYEQAHQDSLKPKTQEETIHKDMKEDKISKSPKKRRV